MGGKLTKRAVENAEPGERAYVVWDSGRGALVGFGCKVEPSGVRTYLAQYRAGKGRRARTRRVTLGRHGVLTCEKARKLAGEVLGEVKTGGDPAEVRARERAALLVSELVERYFLHHAEPRKKPSSTRADRSMADRFIVPALGTRTAARVARADVVKLHQSLRGTPIQANRVLSLCSKLFNLAERWGIRPDGSNPCRHVERFPETRRERFLSGAELADLGQALTRLDAEGKESPFVVLAVRLLVLTGCRLREILTLRWEHVDTERGCLRLPTSKTGAKTVPLGAPALELLANAPREAGSPWVIPGSEGGPLTDLEKPWRRIRAAAGLGTGPLAKRKKSDPPGSRRRVDTTSVRLHDLRHSFASVAAAGSESLVVIGALLGHSQPATTARYAHLATDPLRQAADRIAGEIAAAMATKPEENAAGGNVVRGEFNRQR